MTVVIFFLVLSILVLVHELGHFVVARRAGAKVEEFGLGFPPRLLAVKRGETVYSVNIIPFGGFVKIFGEDEAEEQASGSFGSLKISKRAQVLVAGVTMNFLLAVFLLGLVAGMGQPTLIDDTNRDQARDVSLLVIQVVEGTPATEVGLKAGDSLVGVLAGGEEFVTGDADSFSKVMNENKGREVVINVERGGEELSLMTILRLTHPADEGPLGIALGEVGLISSPWWRAFWDGLVSTINLTIAIIVALWGLLVSLVSGNGLGIDIAGPVGIAVLTGDAARLGLVYLFQFTAVLSVNLAILNILPFPALDGGRLVFLFLEKIKGRPVKKEIENAVNTFGFLLLIALMILVTWKDIARFF